MEIHLPSGNYAVLDGTFEDSTCDYGYLSGGSVRTAERPVEEAELVEVESIRFVNTTTDKERELRPGSPLWRAVLYFLSKEGVLINPALNYA